MITNKESLPIDSERDLDHNGTGEGGKERKETRKENEGKGKTTECPSPLMHSVGLFPSPPRRLNECLLCPLLVLD